MSLLHKLGNIVDDCKVEYEYKMANPSLWEFAQRQEIGTPGSENVLASGDNAAFMEWLLREKNMGGKLKMVYIDPPFFSNADYAAEVKIDTEKSLLKNC